MSEPKGPFDAADGATLAGMDDAMKAMKEKLESIFSKDDPDEAIPGDRRNLAIIRDIAAELVFGNGKED